MHGYLRLFRYAKRQRGYFFLVFVLTLAASAVTALQPWPIKLLIDHVLEDRPLPSWLTMLPGNPSALIPCIVLAGLLVFILHGVIDATLAWSWTVAGRRMIYTLAEDLFARLQRRSLLFHKRATVGDLMGRVSVDNWSLYQLMDTLLFAPGHALLTITLMIILMAQLDVQLTLVSLAIAPLMVAASFFVGKPLRLAARLKREIETRIQAHIQQTLTGIPVVQAFGQEERENLQFERFADAAIRTQQRTALLGSVNSLTTGLVTTVGSGLVLFVGARHVLEGKLELGSILVFLFYLGTLQAEMKVFAALYTTLQGLSASVERVLEVLDAPSELPDPPQPVPLRSQTGSIRFEHVTFGYAPDRPVLKDISFTVQPGQTVALVGSTGAGKTTLAQLLPRFADPWKGRVLIHEQDVRELSLKTIREQVAMVFQESFLLPLSIEENLRFGRPAASRAEVEAAARAANAHEFIAALPQSYDTVIGEHGATLSGGERQRLSIARALLKDAPILVLDEPTSALDAATEANILQALHRLMQGRTTLVIAHRLATVRRADCIYVLDQGEIVESGNHAALMARNGHYANLHRLQYQAVAGPLVATGP